MKKFMILLVVTSIGMSSCNFNKKQQAENSNPFFQEYDTPFNVPPFEKIKPEHYIPAFKKGMDIHKKEVEAIFNSPEEPTYENTIAAFDKSGELLNKVGTVFFKHSSVNTNPEIQKIEIEISPILAVHEDEINLNPKVFERIKIIYDNKDKFNLTSEELFLLENQYKEFILNGANLSIDKKEELKAINQKLSTLSVKFNQNLLAETNDFKLVIDNEKDLIGLPESVIAAGASEAKSAGLEGKWVYTIQRPSMYPFLTYSQKRDLREKLYMAYINRANHDNERDNKVILAEIVKLRAERAKLLGYKTHAHLTLESRMAGNPNNVNDLLQKLWDAALPIAKNEAKQMQDIINAEGGNFKLASWDWWYYAEKIRMSKYNLDESEIRPYFMLDKSIDGAFWLANKLYGITFTKINQIPLPHPDALAYEVKEAEGNHIGLLYMDFYPRESKRGGAWCGTYRNSHIRDGKKISPIVSVVCNFTKPTETTPALLSIEEVSTWFHEFGHALDALFAKTSYNNRYIARDFVELPSQIMEHWVKEPELLEQYAKHYETGEVISNNLVQKIDAASKFNQGFVTVEYLAASFLDMAYHTLEAPVEVDIANFEKEYFNSIGLIPEIISRYRSTYFGHILGGYHAGYYSYIWAGVLDNDAYDAFKENGIFDTATAEKFRTTILEKNGIENAMKMFIDFRGREPIIEPLLKNRGLN